MWEAACELMASLGCSTQGLPKVISSHDNLSTGEISPHTSSRGILRAQYSGRGLHTLILSFIGSLYLVC